jgi:hypothetical protein
MNAGSRASKAELRDVLRYLVRSHHGWVTDGSQMTSSVAATVVIPTVGNRIYMARVQHAGGTQWHAHVPSPHADDLA